VEQLQAKLLRYISVEDRGYASACWVWTRSINNSGYGNVAWNGRHLGAHVASYLAFKGFIPIWHWVLHDCHVRACLCPTHLRLGFPSDNTADVIRRGKHVTTTSVKVRRCASAFSGAGELT
jgi:hypothetical protein